jgi:transposase
MTQQSPKLIAGQRRRLKRRLNQTRDARVSRRLLAILEVAEGTPIPEVARRLGICQRSVYYWVENYSRRHDVDDLLLEDRPGRPTLWTEDSRALLLELLDGSPTQRGYAAVNWTVPLLQEELRHGTGRHFSDETIRRELHRQGFAWKRPRYQLERDPECEKKTADSAANSRLAAAERAAGRR